MILKKPDRFPAESGRNAGRESVLILIDGHGKLAEAIMVEETLSRGVCDREPFEVLAAEFVDRHRGGECPSIEEYAGRHPQLANEIRDLFPTIASLENLRSTKANSSDGRAVAGVPWLTHLGGFRIVRELGRGGMGVVYEAEDNSLKRRVALKVLGANVTNSATQLQRFRHEAEAAARLHHTNIVPVFGTGEEHGVMFYAMQLIDGIPLSEVIDQLRVARSPIAIGSEMAAMNHAGNSSLVNRIRWRDWRTIARVACDLGDALAYAHGQGILHRDIKPANILVDREGIVWISDFGLAMHEEQTRVTATGGLVGTLRYMAPEQFHGKSDARSDIYSLGLTLYELLTLEPAFAESQHGPLIRQKATTPVPSPRLVNAAIPRDLETIVLKACAQERTHRYQTVAELSEDLRRFVEDRPIRARRALPVERLWRWSRRNPLVAGLSGIAVLLLAVVAVVFAVGNQRTNRALRRAVGATQVAHAERKRAEDTLQLAVRALDEIMKNLSERGIPQTLQIGIDGNESPLQNVVVTEADAVLLQSLLHFFDEFASENRANLNAQTAAALQRIGAIQQRLGKLSEAETAFQQSVEIYKKLIVETPGDVNLVTDLATAWNRIGTIRSQRGMISGAFAAHVAAMNLLKSSDVAIASDAGRFQLAETLNLLGSVGARAGRGEMLAGMARSPGSPDGAGRGGPPPGVPQGAPFSHGEGVRQAVGILNELLVRDPGNPTYEFALAKSYRSQIRLALHASSPEESAAVRRAADEAIRILEQLAERFPNSPIYAYELAGTLCRAAQRVPDDGQRRDRENRLQEALQLATQLVLKHPQVSEHQALLASAERQLGEFAQRRGEPAEAERHYHRALELQSQLSAKFPLMSLYRVGYAQTLSEWAEVQRTLGDADSARRTLEKAVGIAESSASLWRNDPVYRDFLAYLHRKQRNLEAARTGQ